MGLNLFLVKLLSSHNISASEVHIVQDNAKLVIKSVQTTSPSLGHVSPFRQSSYDSWRYKIQELAPKSPWNDFNCSHCRCSPHRMLPLCREGLIDSHPRQLRRVTSDPCLSPAEKSIASRKSQGLEIALCAGWKNQVLSFLSLADSPTIHQPSPLQSPPEISNLPNSLGPYNQHMLKISHE